MKRLGICLVFIGISILFLNLDLQADTPAAAPNFKEVYELIRAHAGDLSESELNRAAVNALVSALAPKISLIENESNAPTAGTLLTRPSMFEGEIGYLRIKSVAARLPQLVQKACADLGSSNKLKGVVLDLRYAAGQDYSAAAEVVDLFVSKEQPLIDSGNGLVKSRENANALTVPLAILVNRQTAGASEALAAMLRETGSGLILGNRTAGQAMIGEEYPLSDGQRLRIATAPIRLGDGTVLSSEGMNPDIVVSVSPEDERAYYSDAFRNLTAASYANAALSLTNQGVATNRARRTRVNEAELVRERREASPLDSDLPARKDNEPDKPVVKDPVLARALDLLKGLAVVRQPRS